MYLTPLRQVAGQLVRQPCFWPSLLILIAAVGCSKKPSVAKPVDVEPHVGLAKAELRTISRVLGQPGFLYAYEQTAIYPKVAGYVKEWHVDIGDPIKKGQEIATLFVPELDAELKQKKAQVELDLAQALVAERMVEVATNDVKVAVAQVDEAKAGLNKFEASVERWESEVKRLANLSEQRVVDKQVVDESRKQLKAESSARDAAKATIVAAEATQLAKKSSLDKTKADLVSARAKTQVSREDENRIAALVGYTHITAPYDGIVVTRNANTGDYLQPGSGDQSVTSMGPGQSSAHMPLYVVARTDVIRVYVDVPEMDASSVTRGTESRVHVQALRDEEIPAAITRTSWSLRQESRTLRAEIDLPNPDSRLLPGMYAYVDVLIRHDKVRALPLAAVVQLGNQNCCYLYKDGKSIQTAVQTGISDGKWVEVAKKRVEGSWISFTGKEEVIVGDLSELTDGQKVKVNK